MSPPGNDLATAPSAPRPVPPGEPLRVGVLGLNVWLVAAAIPTLHGSGLAGLPTVAPALVGLALGLVALRRDDRSPLAAWLLLGLFPALLALGIALRPELRAPDALSPLAASLSALSFAAYGALAARAVSRPPRTRTTTRQALTQTPRATEERGRLAWRRAVLVAASLGATLLLAVAPFVRSSTLTRAFPGAASEASVLSALVGGALGALLLAAIVGPGLRAARAAKPPTTRAIAWRLAALATVIATGVAAYVLWERAQ